MHAEMGESAARSAAATQRSPQPKARCKGRFSGRVQRTTAAAPRSSAARISKREVAARLLSFLGPSGAWTSCRRLGRRRAAPQRSGDPRGGRACCCRRLLPCGRCLGGGPSSAHVVAGQGAPCDEGPRAAGQPFWSLDEACERPAEKGLRSEPSADLHRADRRAELTVAAGREDGWALSVHPTSGLRAHSGARREREGAPQNLADPGARCALPTRPLPAGSPSLPAAVEEDVTAVFRRPSLQASTQFPSSLGPSPSSVLSLHRDACRSIRRGPRRSRASVQFPSRRSRRWIRRWPGNPSSLRPAFVQPPPRILPISFQSPSRRLPFDPPRV